MYERIIEIILLLVNELKSSKQLSDIDVAFLARSGYTDSEISSAFSWLFDRLGDDQAVVQGRRASDSSHRVLHEAERMVITPEAYGYLLQWHDLGLLSNEEMEMLIERIMAAGFSSVGESEIKSFLAGFLFEQDQQEGKSRISLTGNDTIH